MVLPIVAYGNKILREKGIAIDKDYPELDQLIANMKETMKGAHGVGLAAPQIGKSIRLFITDGTAFSLNDDLSEEEQTFLKNFKKVFINPEILKEEGESWSFNEGCLSIPDVDGMVSRKEKITVSYVDENFEPQEAVLDGLAARIFQHEFDHIEGVLFVDKISSFKKKLVKKRLQDIMKGKISANYPMKM